MSEPALPRILVVDDERFMRVTLRTMLRAIGRFDVREADDGGAALDLVATFRPQMVLCDVGMEPVGGLAFVQELRRHPDQELCRTRVLMLTGDAQEKTILEAAVWQVEGYLVKPLSVKQLASRVAPLLGRP